MLELKKIIKILIIKNDGIGDLIIVSGLIDELSKIFKAKVDLVTCENNQEIVSGIQSVRNVFYVSRDGLRYNRYLSRLKIYKFFNVSDKDKKILNQIEQQHYDLAICLRRFIRASSLFIMGKVNASYKLCMWKYPTNISEKIAKEQSKGWHHATTDSSIMHELSYFKSVLQDNLRISIDDCSPRLNYSSAIVDTNKYSHSDKKVGICLGGGKVRNWPIKKWMELIQILQRHNWEIFLFGGHDSSLEGTFIENSCAGVNNFVGKLSFIKSIPILRSLTVFIGNETGLTHFASLYIPKVIIIYGGRTFKRFFPWPGADNQYLIYYSLDCFDCGGRCKRVVKRFKCFYGVQPKDVYKYFCEILQSKVVSTFRDLNSFSDKSNF